MTATLLFDLDGTLVETDHLHFAAFQTTFGRHGVTLDWTLYRDRIMGRANPAIAADFLPHVAVDRHAGIMEDKEAAYRSLVDTVAPAPGLLDLLGWAHTAGLRCAVVTNAPRANADLILRALGLDRRFEAMVIGDELSHAKPHPLPYLRALELLGGDAARSIAFEDSPSGAQAAVAAGLGVVGLLSYAEADVLRRVGVSLVARDFADPAVLAFVKDRTGAVG